MATWKQIETSRERRLWFTQVIVPMALGAVALMQVPEVRNAVYDAKQRVGNAMRNVASAFNGWK